MTYWALSLQLGNAHLVFCRLIAIALNHCLQLGDAMSQCRNLLVLIRLHTLLCLASLALVLLSLPLSHESRFRHESISSALPGSSRRRRRQLPRRGSRAATVRSQGTAYN